MRYPPDDAADQPASRRRSQQPGQVPAGPARGEASVFVPGYDGRREPGREAAEPADPPWRGSAAGKGPVRGYPPLPGQPPPLYPPGQFAAWNRRGQGQAGQAAASSPADTGRGADTGSGRAGYFGRDGEEHTEPGYSTLAISDPAADVTSTQTWQAVGDERATGRWSAVARPAEAAPAGTHAGGASRLGSEPGLRGERPDRANGHSALAGEQPTLAGGRPTLGGQSALAGGQSALAGGQSALAGGHSALAGGQSALAGGQAQPREEQLDRPDGAERPSGGGRIPGDGRATGTRRATRAGRAAKADPATRSGAATRSGRAGGTGRATDTRGSGAAEGPGPGRAAGTGRSRSGRSQRSRRGRHPVSVKLAVIGALAIAVIAGIAVYLVGARATARHPAASSPRKSAPKQPAPSPTATLGPYGHIGSRSEDPQPLSVAQLYPASFSAGGVSYVKTKSKLSSDCVDAVNGAGIQGAVGSSVCSQVARATYLASKSGMMGTIGVLNLKTAHEASVAARKTGATNFIAQLAGRKAPTSKIGKGAGIEEALAKGHYLILIWAELTSLKSPHKAAQRAGLEQFMTRLVDGTANVSLTNRMINGSPSPAPGG
jgi:hypothetical protein